MEKTAYNSSSKARCIECDRFVSKTHAEKCRKHDIVNICPDCCRDFNYDLDKERWLNHNG